MVISVDRVCVQMFESENIKLHSNTVTQASQIIC